MRIFRPLYVNLANVYLNWPLESYLEGAISLPNFIRAFTRTLEGLPGGAFRLLETVVGIPPCNGQVQAIFSTGVTGVIFDGESGVQYQTDTTYVKDLFSRARANALAVPPGPSRFQISGAAIPYGIVLHENVAYAIRAIINLKSGY